jgi:hypothetical protein
MNVFGENVNTERKNTESLVDVSMEDGAEV